MIAVEILWFKLENNHRMKFLHERNTKNIVFIIKRRQSMSNNNPKKSTKNHKKEDGTFHSKHINHNPQAESARAVFGLKEDNSKEKEH
jgi:hypothetical protein